MTAYEALKYELDVQKLLELTEVGCAWARTYQEPVLHVQPIDATPESSMILVTGPPTATGKNIRTSISAASAEPGARLPVAIPAASAAAANDLRVIEDIDFSPLVTAPCAALIVTDRRV